MKLIHLDSSQGEGGGQILRSTLTLSMISGVPFRIERIRAGRRKPGLLRQHLTAVQAAAAISGAEVEGAVPGSQSLVFHPGRIRGGEYRFAIGSAGSCTLVLQTVLPALWYADTPSSVTISGGTHNPAAPPADFLIRAWLPLLRRMGVDTHIVLERHGFYPAGGGIVRAEVRPGPPTQRLDLLERGPLTAIRAEAIVAGVPGGVATRETERVAQCLPGVEQQVRQLPGREGPGNALLVEVVHEALSEVFTAFGEKGVAAESVAAQAVRAVKSYLASQAAVGEHLADQLLLPFALAGGGSLTTSRDSAHLATNLEVIKTFLPVATSVLPHGDGWLVRVD